MAKEKNTREDGLCCVSSADLIENTINTSKITYIHILITQSISNNLSPRKMCIADLKHSTDSRATTLSGKLFHRPTTLKENDLCLHSIEEYTWPT